MKETFIPKKVLVLAIAVSLVQLTPTLAGFFVAGRGQFQGFEFPEDLYVYASFVKDAQTNFLLENKNTSEPQLGRYFIPLFNILALVANTGIPLFAVFLLDRFLEIIFLVCTFWIFLGIFLKDAKERFFSLWFIVLAGGLGWLVWLVGKAVPLVARIKSTDLSFWLGYSQFAHMFEPHMLWGFGLALVGFFWLSNYLQAPGTKNAVLVGAVALVIFFIHPTTFIFYSITASVTALVFAVKEKKNRLAFLWPILAVGVFSIPILVYSWWSLQDPVIVFHLGTYITIPKIEPLPFYLLGFGLVLILAIAHLVLHRKKLWSYPLLVCWLLVSFFLTRMGYGAEYLVFLYTILAIFAGFLLLSLQKQWPRFLFWALVIACLLSAPLVLWERFSQAVNSPVSFVSPAENEAFGFLDRQLGGILLSNQRIGQLATWKTPLHVIVGQNLMNINGEEKRQDVNQFFSNPSETILEKYNPDFVWFDWVNAKPDEPLPASLQLVFSNEEVWIYRYEAAGR